MATFSYVHIYEGLKINRKEYTEEGLHRPPLSADLFTDNAATMHDNWLFVTPHPSEEFSRMELPTPGRQEGSYEYDPADTRNFRFICVTMKQPTIDGELAHDKYVNRIFGWIDNVTVKVSKGEKRSIIVDWHPDWYLTMRGTVTYGGGRLLRGPEAYARPDNSEPLRWKCLSVFKFNHNVPGGNVNVQPWVILQYQKTTQSGDVSFTTIETLFWKLGESITYNDRTYQTVPIGFLYNGMLEEYLGIAPSSVIGVYLSPIPPHDPNPDIMPYIYQASERAAYKASIKVSEFNLLNASPALQTTDEKKLLIADPYGAVVGVLPWHCQFTSIWAHLDISPTGASLILTFRDGDTDDKAFAEGRVMTTPLQKVPITSNAWSEYVYSGEREYDITVKRLQQQQNLESGIANSTQAAVSGAMMGSISGGAGGPIGAGAGAALGLITSIGGAYTTSAIAAKYDKLNQKALDRLTANQTGNIIVSGGGTGWYDVNDSPGQYCLVTLQRDAVSRVMYNNEITELGYSTDMLLPSCRTVISQGGGLRIEGLEVKGANTQASAYISALFARGVHID